MSSKLLSSLICLTVAFVCIYSQQQQQVASQPIDGDLESAAAADDLISSYSEHLMGVKCGDDEYLAAGKIPECEPTCKNPNPVCSRMFYASLDYYPCFCKAPLVRDTTRNKCVQISDCP